ncbi:MAG: HNH endonuclease [Agarilytica sp.]
MKNNKPSRYCARCRTTHKDECPNKPKAWSNKDAKTSGRGGARWRAKRKRVFERDMYCCSVCGRPVDLHGPNHGVCDHIVPISQGGTDDESNLQTICQGCDKVKTQEESMHGRGDTQSQRGDGDIC